jgi:hypothetical protein
VFSAEPAAAATRFRAKQFNKRRILTINRVAYVPLGETLSACTSLPALMIFRLKDTIDLHTFPVANRRHKLDAQAKV